MTSAWRVKQGVLLCGPLLFFLALTGLVPGLSRAVSSAPPALDSSMVELVERVGGQVFDVAVQGKHAYLALGNGVVVLDVTEPATPTRRGFLRMPEQVRHLVVEGSYAYLVVGDQSMIVVDIARPEAPIERGRYTSADSISDIAIQGQYVYLSGVGLQIVDISEPAAPRKIGSFYQEGDRYAIDIEVMGGYAYLLHTARPFIYPEIEGRVQIIDISNPQSPTSVGSFASRTPYHQTVYDVAVAGTRAYFLYSFADSGHDRYFLDIVDISAPSTPTHLDTFDLAWNGNYRGIEVVDGLAYLRTSGSVEIIDLETMEHISESLGLGWSYELVFAEGRAYMAAGGRGLRLLEVESAGTLKEIGAFETVGYATDVVAANGYAYVLDQGTEGNHYDLQPGEGIKVIDPGRAAQLVRATIPQSINESAILEGTTLYLPEAYCVYGRGGYCSGGLSIFSVASPTTTKRLGRYEFPYTDYNEFFANRVAVVGPHAYLSTPEVLHILDISNPALPVAVGTYSVTLNDIKIRGDYAYVAGQAPGLQVLDLSTPTTPTLASTPLEVPAQVVELGNEHVYAGSGSRLHILDLADPAHPVELASYLTSGHIRDIFLQGGYAYLAASEGGLEIVDVSRPTRPMGVARYDTAGMAMGVAVAGERIFVADGSEGALILRYGSTLAGRIVDAYGTPSEGVTLSISGLVPRSGEQGIIYAPFQATQRTDGEGHYALPALSPGDYTITPTLPGYSFWPTTRTLTLSDDTGGQDFTILAAPVSTLLEPAQSTTLTLTDTQGLLTELTIPAGTVSEPLTLEAIPIGAVSSPGAAWATHAFDLRLAHGGHPLPDYDFDLPVLVTIAYSDRDVAVVMDESQLSLRRWEGSGWLDAAESCEPDSEYERDLQNDTIALPVCRTGRYALFGPTHSVLLPLLPR